MTTEHLQRQQESGEAQKRNPLRPSSAGKCTRELAYELMQQHGFATYERELIKPEMHRIFSFGHSVEYHIIRQLDDILDGMFEIKYKQQSLSFGKVTATHHPEMSRLIEGSTDLVLWSKKHKCIADVKSKKAKYSSYRDSDWDEFSERLGRKMKSVTQISATAFWVDDLWAFLKEVRDPFLAANFLQLNFYALNPFIVERGIDHGAIIQYNKNTSQLREIRFRPSPMLYESVMNKFQTALEAADNKDPERAPRDFELGSMKCAFCDFNSVCWTEDAKKAWYRTLPPKQWPTDTGRLDEGLADVLEEMHAEYKQALEASDNVDLLSEELCKILVEHEIFKIRFADGSIYDVKQYKSPRPHWELKRGKL
jgi:hypothetical protein